MRQIDITADGLVSALLQIAATETVCILDSCGVRHLGSHLLIAGIEPVSVDEISEKDVEKTLSFLDRTLSEKNTASIFTISYDFGKKLLNIGPERSGGPEPDVFLAQFDALIIHDYASGITRIVGNPGQIDSIQSKLATNGGKFNTECLFSDIAVHSNFTRADYLSAIETIKELIRQGDTYQTNLTQQLSAKLPDGLTPEIIFNRLRRDHPAPFAAFIKRLDSTVVSASPERFFHVDSDGHKISTSPIKGTRPRGETADEDTALRQALLDSEKDRAENTMIVDLLRNDLGRICEYGSVGVEKLCELEEHPTLFHLVSTISCDLRKNVVFSDILKAVFPCGSITGAPKISTMKIIDEIETTDRGLSMGAIGYYIPGPMTKVQGRDPSLDFGHWTLDSRYDLSVAIRTMVIRDQIATFKVGGGIVIDSEPESEYKETLTKAKALLTAIDAHFD